MCLLIIHYNKTTSFLDSLCIRGYTHLSSIYFINPVKSKLAIEELIHSMIEYK